MEITTKTGFQLIGLKLDKKTTNEGGQSNIDCGNLWQQFEQGHFIEEIPNKLSNEIYAVYYAYEGDHTKPFAYFIGCKVAPDTVAPDGLEKLIIPEDQYLKVIAAGKMPHCIANAWKKIWSSETERAYNYDFEVYDERSNDWDNAIVEVFISAKQ